MVHLGNFFFGWGGWRYGYINIPHKQRKKITLQKISIRSKKPSQKPLYAQQGQQQKTNPL